MGRANDCSGEIHLGLQCLDASFIKNVLRFGEFRAARALQAKKGLRHAIAFSYRHYVIVIGHYVIVIDIIL